MALIVPHRPLPLRRVQWRRVRQQSASRSEWTGRTQIVRLPGATRWTVSAEFPPINDADDARQWRRFFEALDGMANEFRLEMGEVHQNVPFNLAVNGAGQTGRAVNVSGMAGSVGSVYLPAGSIVTLALGPSYQTEILAEDLVIATASGLGTMMLSENLRSSPANGVGIFVQGRPFVQMRLTSPTSGWDVETGRIYGFAFEAEEAF